MIYLIYLFIVSSLVVIDQYSKSLITAFFELYESKTLIDGFFKITYVQNFGAGFSIMQNGKIIFYIITPICLIIFLYLFKQTKKDDYLQKSALLLMISGTIGNFIDRLITIYVVDFLDFNIFGYDFPVFNCADIYLTIGVFLFIICLIKENKHA